MNRTRLTIYLMLLAIPFFAQQKYKVVASASMIADMAQNIAGDRLKVELIVPIGGDPHLHQPTPRDARLVASADLILVNGLTFEGWINELIENSGTKAKIVTVTKGISPIASSTYKDAFDPHAWMDASLGLTYIENIRDALLDLDPGNEETYKKNYEAYKSELTGLDNYISREIQKIPAGKRVLITSHDAFAYYGRRYGIQLEAIVGISTEAEAQTSDIVRVTKTIREKKIPAIFIESTINPKLIEQIARDNKVRIGGKLYADSIGNKNSPAPTYIDMLRHNTDTIVTALSREGPDEETQVESNNQSLTTYLLLGLGLLLVLGGLILYFNKKTT